MHRYVMGGLLWFTASGCAPEGEPASADVTSRPGVARKAPTHTSVFDAQLLDIACSYESFGLLYHRMDLTEQRCVFEPDRFVAGLVTPDQMARVSSGGDSAAHGKKLYFLFAEPALVGKGDLGIPLGEDSLKAQGEGPFPVGQAVVKEAWVPEEIPDHGHSLQEVTRRFKLRRGDTVEERENSFIPYVRKDGHLYHAKEKAGLFIMFKLDPQTPDTDQGWVYGTVTADGREVTSAGKVESCMRCHQKAPHDRVFGLPER